MIQDMDELVDVVEGLKSGAYVIVNYAEIDNVKKANLALADGKTIYFTQPYGSDEGLAFTGTIVWSNTDFCETSAFTNPVDLGTVPGGRLILALDID
jgi:hypothetical protein